ncbi:unnamed protein product [Urochloa humidicola]
MAKVLSLAVCFVLLFLLLNGLVAESRSVSGDVSLSRRHRHRRHGHHDNSPPTSSNKEHRTPMLFVFGDDFADNGNMESDPGLGIASRSWRYPFGMSDKAHHRKPTGRYSDGLVQSDFLAKIMGHQASPPAYLGDEWGDVMDPTGLNFAFGDSGVMEVPPGGVPNLAKQVRLLGHLVDANVVEDRDLKDSVALVAYSGNDYVNSTNDEIVAKVVDEIESAVSELLDMGVSKVLVNTVPPFGCSPWQARLHNYTSCDDAGNADSDRHNKALRERLAGGDNVMLLDVNSIITDLVAPREGSALYDTQFTAPRLQACCNATDIDGGGYCGLDGGYTLCDHPEQYFFWDDVHPTQAGWRAVMQLLQGPIMAFLGISNLEHF